MMRAQIEVGSVYVSRFASEDLRLVLDIEESELSFGGSIVTYAVAQGGKWAPPRRCSLPVFAAWAGFAVPPVDPALRMHNLEARAPKQASRIDRLYWSERRRCVDECTAALLDKFRGGKIDVDDIPQIWAEICGVYFGMQSGQDRVTAIGRAMLCLATEIQFWIRADAEVQKDLAGVD